MFVVIHGTCCFADDTYIVFRVVGCVVYAVVSAVVAYVVVYYDVVTICVVCAGCYVAVVVAYIGAAG